MRRSRSQLNDLFPNPNANENLADSPVQNPAGVAHQANDIQSRLDAVAQGLQAARQAQHAAQHPSQPLNPMGQPMPPMAAPQQMPAQPFAAQPAPMGNPANIHPPMHADLPSQGQPYAQAYQPQPHHQPQAGPDISNIKASLERMSSKLQSLSQQTAENAHTGISADAHKQQLEWFANQNHQIKGELLELKQLFANHIAGGDQNPAIAAVQHAIETNFQTIEGNFQNMMGHLQQVANAGMQVDPVAFSKIVESGHNDIERRLQALQSSLEVLQDNPNIYAKTLEASHNALNQRLDDLSSSIMAISDNPDLTSRISDSHQSLSNLIHDLKSAVDQQSHSIASVPAPDFSSVEMRLEEITRAVVALSAGNNGQDNLERIEARVSDLAKTVDQMFEHGGERPQQDTLDRIEAGLLSLQSHKQSELPESEFPPLTPDYSRLEDKIADISNTLDNLVAEEGSFNAKTHEGFERLESRMNEISELVESVPQNLEAAPVPAPAPVPAAPAAVDVDEIKLTLENLDSRINELLNKPSSPQLDNIVSRINMLSGKIDNMNAVTAVAGSGSESNSQAALIVRLDEMVQQIEQIKAEPVANLDTSHLERQIGGLCAEVDMLREGVNSFIQMPSPNPQIGEMMQQIEAMAGAIDEISKQSPGRDNVNQKAAFSAIEKQIAELANSLTSPAETDFEPVTSRLTAIEEQLGASRNIAIELATQAAEEAVQKTLESMPAESDNASAPVFDGEQLNELSDDLRRLYNSTVDNNAQSMETFEAVRDTLEMMAQRLLQIEANVTNQANTYAHSQPMHAGNFVPSAPQMETAPVEPQPAARAAEEVHHDAAEQAQKQSPIEETAGQVAPASYQEVKEEPEAHLAETTSVSEAQNAVNELFAAAKAQEAAELQKNMPAAPEPLTDIETPTLAMEPVSDISPSEGMDDEPLEPGTGGPDLAALVRQANERRKRSVKNGEGTSGTEFLAAARRAAQAAAEEANLIQEEIEMQTEKEEAKEPKGLFAKRKKTIFMAATAALLIAASLPLVSSFLGGSNPLSSSSPAVVETQPPLADETTIEELATEQPLPEARNATPLGEPAAPDTDNSLASSSEEILTSPNTSTGEVNLAVTNIAPEAGDQSASGFVKVDPTATETNFGEAGDFVSPEPKAPAVDVAGLEFAPAGLLEAVAGGDATAMFQIGRHFTDGIGVEKDLVKAAEWYKKSADLGFVPAQYIIGNFNEKGVGLPTDPTKAAEWYEKAASSGHVVAMHNLAVLNASPNVLAAEPNMENAYKWFARAAEYGVRDSQVNSGIFLAKGIGTKPDLVEAYKWFAIAAAAGDKDAESKRDIISNALIPEQLTEAKQRVANWIPIEPNPNANDVEIPDSWKANLPTGPLAVNRNIISQTQKKLSTLGFDAGPADGLMGQKTRNAITAFQRENGLPVSGEIDAELVLALKSVAS